MDASAAVAAASAGRHHNGDVCDGKAGESERTEDEGVEVDGLHFHHVTPGFMNQFGCPHSEDSRSTRAGTGGPSDGTFTTLMTGGSEKRFNGGCIQDENISRESNAPDTLSVDNNAGGSQLFMNVEKPYHYSKYQCDYWSTARSAAATQTEQMGMDGEGAELESGSLTTDEEESEGDSESRPAVSVLDLVYEIVEGMVDDAGKVKQTSVRERAGELIEQALKDWEGLGIVRVDGEWLWWTQSEAG